MQMMDEFDRIENLVVTRRIRIAGLKAELDEAWSRLNVLRSIEPVHTDVISELYVRIGSLGIELRALGA